MCHRHSQIAAWLALAALTAPFRATWAQAPVAPEVLPPSVVHHVDAVYPPSALESRGPADVVHVLTVETDGHVSTVDVAQSSGATDLDEAAVVAE
jgi:outer membrane biosynthesis protein TonB